MSQGRPQPPLCYRLIRDASGQSETFGMLILLAITVVGSTAVVTFGSQALTDTKQASDLYRTEQTMTLLDSRAAMVALGDSEQQDIDFRGSRSGSFRVENDSGWIAVEHMNHSGNEDTEEIYNESMGALVYESDDTEIAYQGGGVWRVEENGVAQMVSKPELHYRGATLTLPVIRMNGSGTASGDVTATVSADEESRKIFPNSSTDYTTNPDLAYKNPIENGTVNVTVHSQYYEAWANYFETRTTANVTVYDGNKTVHVQLETLSDIGEFDTLTNSLDVGGYPEEHSLTNFTVTLEKDKNHWDKVHWSFYTSKGSERFEIHISPNKGAKDCNDLTNTDGVYLNVFYENSSSDESQEWVNDSITGDDGDFIVNCNDSVDELTVNLTATTTVLNYTTVESSDIECGGSKREFPKKYAVCDGDAGAGTVSFDEHDEDDAASEDPYVPGSGHQENVSFINNHYFALLGPDFELQGKDGPGSSSTINKEESHGTLSYDQGGGKFLTYLHITENEVEVDVE